MASLGSVEQAAISANSDISSQTQGTLDALKKLDTTGASDYNLSGGMPWAMGSGAGLAGNIFGKRSEYDFVGIADKNGVIDMKNAVTNYCDHVTKAMEEFAKVADPEGTFAGEAYTEPLKQFVEAIKKSCDATVNSLTKFNDDLQKVYDAMVKHAQDVGSNIADDTSSINSAAGIESN